MSPADRLRRYQAQVEQALDRVLPPASMPPTRLHEAMRYASLNGGKRVRACLVYAAGEALGAPLALLDAPACALELIHAYSLVHDDLPSMDDDDLRRGRPTCHKAFDEATALLAGDALQTLAFETLAQARLDAAVRVQLIAELAAAAGSLGMAGGQAIDLQAVDQALSLAQLEDMHRRKTGALIRAAIRLGALAGAARDEGLLRQLDTYAACIGLAFQVVDDILDVEGETATLGKRAGADQARKKPTYATLLGLAGAKAKAEELRAQAVESLKVLGDNGAVLAYMADFIVRRTH